ncbi:MAG: precorrin-3B C(17)-methyltransferase [Desulfobacterales bacterium]|nr:precorrin-3B C(17)-methyltransferase [Desulfobacterales bacterium]
MNTLYIIGTGPGNIEYLTKQAYDILKSIDSVVGYTTYIELIQPLIEGKNIFSTSMQKEVERVNKAIEIAMSGQQCAIISGGDSGIYGMASLVFEVCREKNICVITPFLVSSIIDPKNTILIEVIPGVPALCAASSLLGAPIGNDFAVISLSDLLNPWEVIEKRIEAAAQADFTIVIYNPKSKKRDWQIEKAKEIILKYRDKNTPVGIVNRAMRENQSTHIIPLDNLSNTNIDMQTIVIIGNSNSYTYLDFMITPRGYLNKYDLS